MRDLTVFVGGSVGSDPYAPGTWSGSSRHLLAALSSHQLLDKAVGLKLSKALHYTLLLRNFARDRAVWRKHFYFDPQYRNALTRAAAAIPVESPCCLQIGAMFSLPAAFPGNRCLSFHDGNLPEALASGFGFEGVSHQRIDQALRYEEEAAQQMTALFTSSEYLRQSFIRDYHVPPGKVFAIGAGVNFDAIPPVSPDKVYTAQRLLFIGIDFVRKGGPQLLRAFTILRQTQPTAELHIVGPKQIGVIPAGVTLHGRLSRDNPQQKQQLETLFRASTLFVMPSLYEPFGIAPLEAMFYQLPCLLTDAWALRETVTPGYNGDLVEKGSVDDLAAKLAQLLSNPAHLATMGRQAREFVAARYTWDAVVERMIPLLHAES